MTTKELDQLCVSAVRSTCIDAINKAKSGHPGMALGSAPILFTLFKNHLIANPKDPTWFNRDRFVLSSGHASSLLYSLLHICGYKITMDDIKSFRQLNSKTPGHPEIKVTPGVDAPSGPLAQGIGEAVGFAMAEACLSHQYKDGEKLVNHYTYCLCGDGCLEEGLSQEAISFAGHQQLNKLILIYDSNKITLDGAESLSNNDDVKTRFKGCHWNVLEVTDGNDLDSINKAIKKAKKSTDKPTLIIVNTVIGFGSAKQGTNKVHGAPLGEEDGRFAKKESYLYDYDDFFIPEEVYSLMKKTFAKRGKKAEKLWKKTVDEYRMENPDEYSRFQDALECKLPNLNFENIPFDPQFKEATRASSGKFINLNYSKIPFLMGGAADVASSIQTKINGITGNMPNNRESRIIDFGIREFAMSSIQNGMILHGGLKVFSGSFMVFSDYMKPAMRMAALSNLPAIYVFSHDSIAVGEDGPTHQPIEHLAMLRSIPGLNVIRPADANETLGAWKIALESKNTPTAIILSRQGLPLLQNSDLFKVSKGAYIVSLENKKLDYQIIATGSEVDLAIKVQKILLDNGVDTRVVSMPSTYLFDKTDEKNKKNILPLPKSKTISLEMLTTFGWGKYADINIGIDTFGTSAPASDVIEAFGFTSESVANKILELIEKE